MGKNFGVPFFRGRSLNDDCQRPAGESPPIAKSSLLSCCI